MNQKKPQFYDELLENYELCHDFLTDTLWQKNRHWKLGWSDPHRRLPYHIGDLDLLYRYSSDVNKHQHQWNIKVVPQPWLHIMHWRTSHVAQPATMLAIHVSLRDIRLSEGDEMGHRQKDLTTWLAHYMVKYKTGIQMTWFRERHLFLLPSFDWEHNGVSTAALHNHKIQGCALSVLKEFDDSFLGGLEIILLKDRHWEGNRHKTIVPWLYDEFLIQMGGRYQLAENYVVGIKVDQQGEFQSTCHFQWKEIPLKGYFTLRASYCPFLNAYHRYHYRQGGCSIAYEDKLSMKQLREQKHRFQQRFREKIAFMRHHSLPVLKMPRPRWWYSSWFHYRLELTGSGIWRTLIEWRIPLKQCAFAFETLIDLRYQTWSFGTIFSIV
jgi:hypothetical protein